MADLDELRATVDKRPGDASARIHLGVALLEAGSIQAAAEELYLGAQLSRTSPDIALIAVRALERCGRARDAALLMSTRIVPASRDTLTAPEELAALEALLDHPEPFVRSHTARGAGRLRIVDTAPALERACADQDGAVRIAAEKALKVLRAY